jgi:1-acyl-sn-glycerol-3-phosphate acyltransferase
MCLQDNKINKSIHLYCMSIINHHIDNDKILNSRCSCGVGLPWVKGNVVMAHPCEHMYHEKCFNGIMITCMICRLCGEHIEKKITLFDENIDHQRFADLLSMSYYDNMCNNTPGRFLDSIFDIASIFARMSVAETHNDAKKICEHIFSLNNVTLTVHGMEKIKLEKNKVYICNHVSYFEFVVIYYLLGTGFLASSIGSSQLDKLKKVISLLIVDRGDANRKVNIVDEMRKFVDEKGSICLFPEGMMKHPDALIRFRSGAFHIARPIYAITIRHNDIISDGYVNGFLYKLGAKRDINLEVHILGPYYPPFTDCSIEQIRTDMARYGNMIMSRVSNRDIVDKKKN